MVMGTKGPEFRTLIKRMPFSLRVGNVPGGDTEYISIQAAIDYADSQTGDWTIFIYPGTYDEGDITPGGGADITLKGMGEGRVVIAPTAAPATAVIVSAHTLMLEDIIVTAPDATKPALNVTGSICSARNCEFNGVGAGDSIDIDTGTLNMDGCDVNVDIELHANPCTLNARNCSIIGGINTAAEAIAHNMDLFECDMALSNIVSAATAGTTLELYGCTRVGTVNNSGTGAFTIRKSDVTTINHTNAGGTVTVYGGYVNAITRAVGSVVWWLDSNTLKVIPSGTTTDTVIGWALATAGAGDVILIHPGLYDEAIACVAGVDIRGVGPVGSVVIYQNDANVINLADNVQISDLTVRQGTPTLDRYHIGDNTVSCTARINHVVFEVTTPGAVAWRGVVLFGSGSDITIENCSCELGGTGFVHFIYCATNAGAVHLINNDFEVNNVNANLIRCNIGTVFTGGGNRWAGTCRWVTVSLGTILFDGDRVDCSGGSVITGGSVCIKNGQQEYHVWAGMLVQHAITAAAADTPAPAATAPYTVYIHPGIYDEALTCATWVNLKGVNRDAVVIQQTNANIMVLASNICVESFIVRLVTPTLARRLILDGAGAVTGVCVKDVILEVTTPGAFNHELIYLSAASTVILEKCRVSLAGSGNSVITAQTTTASTLTILSCDFESNSSGPAARVIFCSIASAVCYVSNSRLSGVAGHIGCPAGTVRVRNSQYRSIRRSATGNVLDESPNLQDAPWKVQKWNWMTALASADIAVRGTPVDAGSGQILLEVNTGAAADAEAVETNPEVAGSLGNEFTPARTPRFITQIAVDNFHADADMFFGLRETLANAVPGATEDHAGFIWNGTNFIGSSDDGVASQTTVLVTPTVNVHVQLEVIVFGGVTTVGWVEFYIDGVLVATHSTRIPVNGLDWQHLLNNGAGGGAAADIDVTVRPGGCQECPA